MRYIPIRRMALCGYSATRAAMNRALRLAVIKLDVPCLVEVVKALGANLLAH